MNSMNSDRTHNHDFLFRDVKMPYDVGIRS